MRIEIADKAGFCFGVKRAIGLAEEAAAKYGEAVTLGELIHNERVIEELETKGIRAVETVEEAKGRPLVIRSHGVPAETERKARAGSEVIDATCPFVKEIHKIAAGVPESGTLIVLGDKDHPEVVGIVGNARCKTFTAKTCGEVERIMGQDPPKPVVAVVQTTFDSSGFSEITRKLSEKHCCVEIYNTICSATEQRQKSARELSRRAALMIVVGGRSSSNTRKLTEICESCTKTVFVTCAGDVPPRILDGLRSDAVIGITAGASTPAYTIKEVHDKMNEEITKIN